MNEAHAPSKAELSVQVIHSTSKHLERPSPVVAMAGATPGNHHPARTCACIEGDGVGELSGKAVIQLDGKQIDPLIIFGSGDCENIHLNVMRIHFVRGQNRSDPKTVKLGFGI